MRESDLVRRSVITVILAGAIATVACSGRSNPATTPTATTTTVTSVLDGAWRGLTVAPEDHCSPYNADDYRYPQVVEDDIVRELEGIYSPYTCESFDSDTETDTSSPGQRRTTPGCAAPMLGRKHGSPAIWTT